MPVTRAFFHAQTQITARLAHNVPGHGWLKFFSLPICHNFDPARQACLLPRTGPYIDVGTRPSRRARAHQGQSSYRPAAGPGSE